MKDRPVHPILLVLTLVVAGTAAGEFPQQADLWEQKAQAVALARLRARSETRLKVRFDRGIPRSVSMSVKASRGKSDDPVGRALDFLDSFRDLYRIADPRSELFLDHLTTNEIGQHVVFGQHRENMPVFAAQLAVHIDKDRIIATNGSYLTAVPPAAPAIVDDRSAVTIALKSQHGDGFQLAGEPKLVYFNAGLYSVVENGSREDRTRQAWQLTVQGTAGSWMYFIDAQDGAVLLRLDLISTHAARKDFSIRTANGTTGTLCMFLRATDWFDEHGRNPRATPDGEGFSAYNAVHQVYDFYYNNFHRHSWNGNEGEIPLILEEGGNRLAFFDELCKHFVFHDGSATLDVIAHEVPCLADLAVAQTAPAARDHQEGPAHVQVLPHTTRSSRGHRRTHS